MARKMASRKKKIPSTANSTVATFDHRLARRRAWPSPRRMPR
jgi:hypothetical protein